MAITAAGREGNEIAGEIEGGNETIQDKEVMLGLLQYKDTGYKLYEMDLY